MDTGSNGEQPTSWEELYSINLMPSELFLKFRKELEGFRVGVNLELYNAPINDIHAKLVLKPLSPDRRWKFIYEPIHHDVRLLSKKIPLTKFLNLQVGIGHNFKLHATGWKWKLTTCLGGDGISCIQNKTSVNLCPGVDFRFGWRADYVLPEITGALGTDEPLFNMNSGRLQASLDRVEAILTHSNPGTTNHSIYDRVNILQDRTQWALYQDRLQLSNIERGEKKVFASKPYLSRVGEVKICCLGDTDHLFTGFSATFNSL